jgi:WD40 repeat protein
MVSFFSTEDPMPRVLIHDERDLGKNFFVQRSGELKNSGSPASVSGPYVQMKRLASTMPPNKEIEYFGFHDIEGQVDERNAVAESFLQRESSPLISSFGKFSSVHSFDGLMVARWGIGPLTLCDTSNDQLLIDFSDVIPQQARIGTVGFSADNRVFTVVLEDSSLFQWDLESKALLTSPNKEKPSYKALQSSLTNPLEIVSSQTSTIDTISTFSSNGQMIARWGSHQPLTLCDTATGQSILDLSCHIPDEAVVASTGFTSNDLFFMAVLADRRLLVWDLLMKDLITGPPSKDAPLREQRQQKFIYGSALQGGRTPLVLPPDFVYSVRSSNGLLIARWGRKESLAVCDAENGRTIVDVSRHIPLGGVRSAGFSSDDQFFTAVLIDFASLTWDLRTGQLLSPNEPGNQRARSDKACCSVM